MQDAIAKIAEQTKEFQKGTIGFTLGNYLLEVLESGNVPDGLAEKINLPIKTMRKAGSFVTSKAHEMSKEEIRIGREQANATGNGEVGIGIALEGEIVIAWFFEYFLTYEDVPEIVRPTIVPINRGIKSAAAYIAELDPIKKTVEKPAQLSLFDLMAETQIPPITPPEPVKSDSKESAQEEIPDIFQLIEEADMQEFNKIEEAFA